MSIEELERVVAPGWPVELHGVLQRAGVRHVCYVPDAGHTALINLCIADDSIETTVLTTEEEGVAIAAGAWLGGTRAALLMQSSGVGNCINMLSLPVIARMPLLMLVTMRGDWGEFNPWQNAMGRATQACLEAIGVTVIRADSAIDVAETVQQATTMVYEADQQVAVLLGQRLLGEKKW
jgi:sulfopyruvate decarboxylase alpha subunit